MLICLDAGNIMIYVICKENCISAKPKGLFKSVIELIYIYKADKFYYLTGK